jgi:hypothetical protein
MVTGSGFRSARERQGWNDVRAADTRNEIAALVRRGVWRPPNDFALDPREKDPGFHEFSSDWLKRYRRTVKPRSAETAENLLGRHALPFLHPYTLKEIDYALLSSYVSQKLERNDEIERAVAAAACGLLSTSPTRRRRRWRRSSTAVAVSTTLSTMIPPRSPSARRWLSSSAPRSPCACLVSSGGCSPGRSAP